MTAIERRRFLALRLGAVVVFAVLGAQLVRLQLIAPTPPPILASGEIARVVESAAARGLIYDRDGRPLVANVPAYALRLVPADLPTDDRTRRTALVAIERESGVSVADLEAATQDGLAAIDPTAPIEVRALPSATEAIRLRAALATIPGVEVTAVPHRVYTGGDLVGHLVGHVGAIAESEVDAYLAAGYALDATVGQSGLEATYEDALRGRPARRLVVSDPTGRDYGQLSEFAAQPGAGLQLSIDLGLQRATTDALLAAIEAGLPPAVAGREPPTRVAAAVALDVHSGEVLAQVSLPSFDPNILGSGDDKALLALFTDPARPLVDRTYMEAHAPGSTFKTLVAYAALEEGVATPDTTITSTGAIYIQDEYDPSVTYTFRDWAAHGSTNLYWGLARSSDVYFYYLSGGYARGGVTYFEGLGATRLASYARQIGLGSATGLDLPGEVDGLVPDPDWKSEAIGDPWFLGDTYTFGIGQGYLAVSPMQMAVLTAAIANDGDILEPRLVRGLLVDGKSSPTPRVVRSHLENHGDSLAIVREAMRITAGPGGTATAGQPSGLTIGGKTGTAEFGAPYADGHFDTHGWYIAFAPFEDPQIAVAVYIEHGVGSTHAAPVARAMFEYYFDLGVASDD
ncbi:MAG: hypothetical protein DWG79_01475 [Chloroflexi bacterium]|nr:penicillin-binding transpeptidase domain-containing protein [Chloroflexota bacterium]MDA1147877.1 penicillin-binding transpeptidase domain-containing protein [Chloroflexota bacterium]MQC82526.1 hypothetical protein [Chloroflexota bacterium]MQC83150.1 hypothetical protein [Chloroflexota bacterium]